MKETKFKQTEIGTIPSDWEVKKLGDLGEPCMCKRILKQQTSSVGDIPFYKIGTFGGEPDAYISRSVFEEFKAKYNYPKKGTLLLSAAGTIGRVVVFDGKDSYFQDSNIVWIDNDEKLVLNDFLYYCYSQMKWTTENGGTVSRLYNENLKSASFAAPKSIEEQKRIAQALSDVDTVISTTEKLIAKKKALKQGTMQTLLSGKMRIQNGKWTKTTDFKQTELGPIPQEWEIRSIGETAKIIGGGTPSTFNPDFWNGEIAWFTPAELSKAGKYVSNSERTISSLGLNNSSAKMLPKGTILLTTRASIGVSAILEKPACTNQGFQSLVANKDYSNEFLYYLLKTKVNEMVGLASGSTFLEISPKKLGGILLSLPPTKEEQISIATVLSDMDSEIAALETKLAKYRQLKTGMMQQPLTGKIRLV